MKKITLLTVFSIVLSFVLLSTYVAFALPSGWSAIDTGKQGGGEWAIDFALKGQSTYHIIDAGMNYVTNKSGSWTKKQLTTDGFDYGNLIIKTAANGKIYIAYETEVDNWVAAVKLLTFSNGAWSKTKLTNGYGQGDYLQDLATYKDHAYVLYVSSQDNALYLKTNRSGSWKRIKIADINDAYPDDGRLFISNGKIYVVFHKSDGNDYELYLKTNKSGSWVTTRITNNKREDYPKALRVENGKVHMLFWRHDTGFLGGDLFYITNASGKWVTKRITNTEGSVDPYDDFGTSDMEVKNGKAHITYTINRLDSANLKYSTNKSGSWATKTLKTASGYGLDTIQPSKIELYGDKPRILSVKKVSDYISKYVILKKN